NASRESNREFEQIAREILAEAKATDEAEDQLYGEARGDELPEQLRTSEGRREFFAQAKQKKGPGQETDTQALEPEAEKRAAAVGGELEFDAGGSSPASRVARGGCVTPAASLSSAAGRSPIGFRVRGL